MILDFAIPPSPKLYNTVRAGLIANGDTLGNWAKCNNESLQFVKCALIGQINSPRAKAVRRKIVTDIKRGNHDQAS